MLIIHIILLKNYLNLSYGKLLKSMLNGVKQFFSVIKYFTFIKKNDVESCKEIWT